MSRLLLDTSILIKDARVTESAHSPLVCLAQPDTLFLISAVVDFEFRVGCRKPTQLLAYELLLLKYRIEILPFDAACASRSAGLHNTLKVENAIIGKMDTFIAATALVHDLPLATLNRKHFERVPGLELV